MTSHQSVFQMWNVATHSVGLCAVLAHLVGAEMEGTASDAFVTTTHVILEYLVPKVTLHPTLDVDFAQKVTVVTE